MSHHIIQAFSLQGSDPIFTDSINCTADCSPLSFLLYARDHTPHFSTLVHSIMQWVWEYGMLGEMTREDAALAADMALLHDAGKHLLPASILEKADRLTPEEFHIVQKHPIWGEALLSCSLRERRDTSAFTYAIEICLHHHERWDGAGYPDGLKGMEIPMYVQVVSLSDVYDALVAQRSYRPPMGHRSAANLILSGGCGAFSPVLRSILAKRAQQIEALIYKEAPHE
ncbi:HD domain-containing protein [Oscillibacter hominis]|uniref:HD domain-containing protein n=1 Tax=Oscillibacter hominis TaxID=2763056 RepID=A0A7G9B3E3_9FIRM|nr:HD domain-containing phosphohydrolase [Oscillibacter hominis]QNL44074.1 HD domain-containing protein [Oscillibacter hominis]